MTELSQLKLRCRRSIKELDIVLGQYLNEYFETNKKHEESTFNTAFKQLLNLEDPTLYAMLLGNVEPLKPTQKIVLHKLQSLHSNTNLSPYTHPRK